MNHQLWSEHLAERIRELEDELRRARKERDRQRQRAEYWALRCLSRTKFTRGSDGTPVVYSPKLARRPDLSTVASRSRSGHGGRPIPPLECEAASNRQFERSTHGEA